MNNNQSKQLKKSVRLHISNPYRHGVIAFLLKLKLDDCEHCAKGTENSNNFTGSLTNRERQHCFVCWDSQKRPASSIVDKYSSVKFYL